MNTPWNVTYISTVRMGSRNKKKWRRFQSRKTARNCGTYTLIGNLKNNNNRLIRRINTIAAIKTSEFGT